MPSAQPLDPPPRQPDALALAYAYLGKRERTVAEVRCRLEREAIEPGEAEAAIGELIELGYLDDARYARVFAEDRRHLDQWGSDRIARTLTARGIDPELVREAVGGEAAGTELERAVDLLARRFPQPPAGRRERERALGVLLRKGYDSDLALDAIARHARDID